MSDFDFDTDSQESVGSDAAPPELFTPQEKEDAAQGDPRQGLPPSVQVVEAPGPMDLQGPIPGATGPWIKYIGVATVRIMDAKAWEEAGVASEKYCEWNYLNNKRLPRSMFTDHELQYLLRVDRRFIVEED